MKTTGKAILSITAISPLASTAFAAAGGREDHSSLVIWGFLGFCALIVIVQLFPAIRNAQLVARRRKTEEVKESTASVAVEK